MKEVPLIFKADSIKAILAGTKTQTRRVITERNSEIGESGDWTKLCWDGSQVHKERLNYHYEGIIFERKAPYPFVDGSEPNWDYLHVPYDWEDDETIFRVYPRLELGDRIWGKERFIVVPSGVVYLADDAFICSYPQHQVEIDAWLKKHGYNKPFPSIFMPHWASRIVREVTQVRAQRLHDISPDDIYAEGIDFYAYKIRIKPIERFIELWDSLNAKRGHPWEKNDWVWAYTFKEVKNVS